MTSFSVQSNPASAPLVAERLSDRLAVLLAGQVEQGLLSRATACPPSRSATAHDMSRTVVREAVHQLKSQGLLLSRQGLGVFVAPASANKHRSRIDRHRGAGALDLRAGPEHLGATRSGVQVRGQGGQTATCLVTFLSCHNFRSG